MLVPIVVARRTLRREAGFRSARHQVKALRTRILRATNDDAWPALWAEMLGAVENRGQARRDRQNSRAPQRPRGQAPTPPAIARATRLAKEAAYGRATKSLAQKPSLPYADPGICDKLAALHPPPPQPIFPLTETSFPLRLPLDPSHVAARGAPDGRTPPAPREWTTCPSAFSASSPKPNTPQTPASRASTSSPVCAQT